MHYSVLKPVDVLHLFILDMDYNTRKSHSFSYASTFHGLTLAKFMQSFFLLTLVLLHRKAKKILS